MTSPKPFLGLLHGWGMNARVFDPIAGALAASFEVHAFNLPGHGGRDDLADNSVSAWARDLASSLPAGAMLLGWSLGGQVALRVALDYPASVARLVLLATTPRFVAKPGWSHALATGELDTFADALLAQPESTLLRFLSLQIRGVDGQKALLQSLRTSLSASPAPTALALSAGLEQLRTTDLRDEVARVRQPVLLVHGGLDTLTPLAAGSWLAAQLPDARLLELPRAGHAPHLSHREAVVEAIRAFCHA